MRAVGELSRGLVGDGSMTLAFQGTAWALSFDGLARVASNLGVFAPEIWTVLAVETSGCGFLPDRRPRILFERHIFHRLTQSQHDADGDISNRTPGGYGPSGAHQFDRLAAAISDDRTAALQSASWGIGQILGENFSAAGFRSVDEMVTAMAASEDQQLEAMSNFLRSLKLQPALQAHDWATFARGYNGPKYAINGYDVRLNAEYQRYSSAVPPDLSVRAVQLYLTYLGFHPGQIDGMAGQRTLSTLAQFQTQKDLAVTNTIDENTVTQLRAALPA
jgi:hypothetical protein